MKLFYFLFVIAIVSFTFCKEGKTDNCNNKQKINTLSSINLEVSPLWSKLCDFKEFEIISECKIKNEYTEYYEVKLTNDPFKPAIIISLFFYNNHAVEIYLTQIQLTSEYQKKYKTKYKNYFRMDSILNDTPIYCYYNTPKKINFQKQENKEDEVSKLDLFFSQTLWLMSEKDTTQTFFDPEIWAVKATKGDKRNFFFRQEWNDEVYYEHIQMLLDLCKVSDYTYKRKR